MPGSFIDFRSWLARIGIDRPAYAAAKGGIAALTRTLAGMHAAGHTRQRDRDRARHRARRDAREAS